MRVDVVVYEDGKEVTVAVLLKRVIALEDLVRKLLERQNALAGLQPTPREEPVT